MATDAEDEGVPAGRVGPNLQQGKLDRWTSTLDVPVLAGSGRGGHGSARWAPLVYSVLCRYIWVWGLESRPQVEVGIAGEGTHTQVPGE